MDSRLLPEGFVTAYEALVARAVDAGLRGEANGSVPETSEGTGGIGKADGSGGVRWRVDTSEVDTVGGGGYGRAQRGKAQAKVVGKTGRGQGDAAMWRVRVLIDKRLRQMGREIVEAIESGGEKGRAAARRVCGGRCARLGQGDWKFCPNCGSAMRELDSSDAASNSS